MMDFFKTRNKTFAIGIYFSKTSFNGDVYSIEIGFLLGHYAIGITF